MSSGTQYQSQVSQSQSLSQSQCSQVSQSQFTAGESAVVDRSRSEVLVRNVIRAAVSTLCWARQLLPEDCFVDRELAGLTIKKFQSDHARLAPDCLRLKSWLEQGIFDVIKKSPNCVFTLNVLALDAKSEADCVVESYAIKTVLREPDGTESGGESQAGSVAEELVGFIPSPSAAYAAIRDDTAQILRNITALSQTTLFPLPSKRRIEMRISFNCSSEVPDDYQPKNFTEFSGTKKQAFARTPLRVRLGHVRTQFHSVQVALSSVLDVLVDCSSLPLENWSWKDSDLALQYNFPEERSSSSGGTTSNPPPPKKQRLEEGTAPVAETHTPFEPRLELLTENQWESALEILSAHCKESITQRDLKNMVVIKNTEAVLELMSNLFKSGCLFLALGRNLIDRERVRQLLTDRGIRPPPVARELLDRLFQSYHVDKERLYRSTVDEASSQEQQIKESIVAVPIEQTTTSKITLPSSQGLETMLLPLSQSQHALFNESGSQCFDDCY